ncbi:MAG: hypothetical protein NW208_14170 [Bryobacter sp.]|nr:hypothetical protein [Bryobacter sp.]
MARGWESKDVENQQQERDAGSLQHVKTQQEQRIESLRLQRSRVLRDLAVAANPRYRAMLEETYRFLEAEIQRLSVPAANSSE